MTHSQTTHAEWSGDISRALVLREKARCKFYAEVGYDIENEIEDFFTK